METDGSCRCRSTTWAGSPGVPSAALSGKTLVLREGFDPGGTADDIDTYDVTGISLVPTMLQQMLDRRGPSRTRFGWCCSVERPHRTS